MALYLVNLDERTRQLMLEEVEYDSERNQLHISPYLSGQGQHDYAQLLREAVAAGSDETLAGALQQRRRIARTAHRRQPKGGYQIVTVPATAAQMIAESEFNRYYIRALCRRALEDGIPELVVYRAKPVKTARPESEALLETAVDPQTLLDDLRQHTGDEPPALGIPGGPNSGLSVRLP
jgi:DNA repair photolyase